MFSFTLSIKKGPQMCQKRHNLKFEWIWLAPEISHGNTLRIAHLRVGYLMGNPEMGNSEIHLPRVKMKV